MKSGSLIKPGMCYIVSFNFWTWFKGNFIIILILRNSLLYLQINVYRLLKSGLFYRELDKTDFNSPRYITGFHINWLSYWEICFFLPDREIEVN